MNRRIAAALAAAGSLLMGPAALAAAAEPASAPGYDLESAGDEVLDHGQEDDHDHDGDGRPDHDPEDHDDDDDDEKSDDDE
jgi:Spy/CpxP family protein refolding chaperone